MRRLFARVPALLLALWLAAGCTLPGASTDAPTAAPTVALEGEAAKQPQAPAGFIMELAAEGLVGPTQMILGPDGALWVANLNGGENAGRGQVLAVDLASDQPAPADRRVLLDNLLKPTGIAVLDGALWVATRRDLLRAPLTEGSDGWTVGAPATVLADLPFNGRSNGTLTVTPWGTLLYETSGSQVGGEASTGSGTLWELDPTTWQSPAPRAVAEGLKGAYAHLVEGDRLWIGEIGDDPVNGSPPPDELNVMAAPAPGSPAASPPDFGWPGCFGLREAATNLGGTPEECAGTQPPVVLFAPRASPVSLALAPWDAGTLLVALWVSNQVLAVPVAASLPVLRGEPPDPLVTAWPFLTNVLNPQSLLDAGDGALLVAEYATGRIFRVAAAPSK
ncbi:MAG: PQQ-dependent sugar dehydrogenase [Caldilineaceae bacterium]